MEKCMLKSDFCLFEKRKYLGDEQVTKFTDSNTMQFFFKLLHSPVATFNRFNRFIQKISFGNKCIKESTVSYHYSVMH